jgi:spermidine synthase
VTAPDPESGEPSSLSADLVFALTIGLGAFLLFQVQFILGKLILPWFGGASSVWTACMLFFQTGLLAGYGYAHGLVKFAESRRQRAVHLSLIAGAGALTVWRLLSWPSPLTPPAGMQPVPGGEPVGGIVFLLTVIIGLPFLVLSATSPLLQAWFAKVHPGRSPYRLYALSNAGSLLGLLTYPVLFEPFLTLQRQGQLWSALFGVYLVGCSYAAFRAGRTETGPLPIATAASNHPARPVAASQVVLWFLLAAVPSILLLAVTNQLTQEVAVIPFLWVLPLTLYLLTFILCFEFERFYKRGPFAVLFLLGVLVVAVVVKVGVGAGVLTEIATLSGTLFVFGIVCHGELVRAKPDPSQLTLYYLVLSAGGAAGGLFNGILAPRLFLGFWELPASILIGPAVVFAVLYRDRDSWFWKIRFWPFLVGLLGAVSLIAVTVLDSVPEWVPQPIQRTLLIGGVMVAAAFLAVVWGAKSSGVVLDSPAWKIVASILFMSAVAFSLVFTALKDVRDVLQVSRNFFGVLRVIPNMGVSMETSYLALRHGRITHGIQLMHPLRKMTATSYYGEHSGVGLSLRWHPRRPQGALKAGLVGLGTGTIAAFAQPGDVYRFYEINPAVVELSSGPLALFTYLRDSKGTHKVILGDARLSLEREPPQDFDVLALDAFSSDSIPVHLLTSEAFDVYMRHLRAPDGVIAVHISNRFLELEPVVMAQANRLKLKALRVDSAQEGDVVWGADWILLTRGSFFEHPVLSAAGFGWKPKNETVTWTDSFSNLFRVLKKKK